MEGLKNLEKLKETDEEKKKRRCTQGASQIGQVCAAVAMIVIGAIHHEECIYREVQLNVTLEIEVFYVLFERCCTKNRKGSIKKPLKYFNFWS